MRIWLLALLVVLAGCTGSSNTIDTLREGYPDGFQAGSDGMLELSVSVSEAGEVPATVTFDIDVDAIDELGNMAEPNVRWGIFSEQSDLEADGEGLEGQASLEFDVAGEWTFVVGAMASGFGMAFETVTVEVLPPPPAGIPFEADGTVTIACEHCFSQGFQTCVSKLTGQEGIDCFWVPLEDFTWGRPYATEGPADVDIEFWTACGSSGSFIEANGAAGHDEGTVPDNAGCIFMADYLQAGSISLTVS